MSIFVACFAGLASALWLLDGRVDYGIGFQVIAWLAMINHNITKHDNE